MNFTVKQIKRAYRDISNIMDDILNTDDMNMYKTYIGRFINEIKSNNILNFILEPYFNMEVNGIKEREYGYGVDLDLPEDMDSQIAFVVQNLNQFSQMKALAICINLHGIYGKKTYKDNILPWNMNVVNPVFREICIRISDLIEDIPKEKSEVESKYMTIINYGNYNSSNGQVANGNQNNLTQNINSDEIFEELINKINNDVEENEKDELIELINKLKYEKGKPKFKEIVAEFISKTAKYGPIFIDLWSKLQKITVQ
ncbi:TPA: hypothetical protein LA460_000569 [Clostridium botulinum]|nr:hypothetical protein [Clostridium botulinum]HBJ1653157.1 hypothetical protein [Clostridium botulinum]